MYCCSLFVLSYFFFWPLCCLFFFDLRILISSLWYLQTFEQCVVGPSLMYGFWLPLWYLQTFDHCVVCPLMYGFWLPLWYLHTVKKILIQNHKFKLLIELVYEKTMQNLNFRPEARFENQFYFICVQKGSM